MRACLATLVLLGATGAPVRAEGGAADVTLMVGVCRRLTTPADDLSRGCGSVVVSTTHARDGRVGFHFASGRRAVTFSGGAKAIRVSDNTGVQAIDKVEVETEGVARVVVAVGQCRYLNHLTAKPTVTCKAESEEGIFLAAFDVTNVKASRAR